MRNLVIRLRGQLWLLPALIGLSAAALAILLLYYRLDLGGESVWWLNSGDQATARGLLSSLLTGLITMTSLVVSVTFVILALSANQLGPRLISVFVQDKQIQSVLGLFLGTVLYLILVLRTLDDASGSGGVPHTAVTVGSALTIASLCALIFYIHKIARSIIPNNVVTTVSNQLKRDLRNILPKLDEKEGAFPDLTSGRKQAVGLARQGYIQTIDYEALAAIACRASVVLEVKVRAGDHVLEAGDHVFVHSNGPLDAQSHAIRDAITIGDEQTPSQDPEFGLRQLVEIAVRALSPGLNDPFTAIAVINRLGEAFEYILPHSLQQRIFRDEVGKVRVVADRPDAFNFIDGVFDPLRRAAVGHPSVLITCAETLSRLSPVLEGDDARFAVLAQLAKLEESARHARLTPSDRTDTLDRVQAASATIHARWGRAQPTLPELNRLEARGRR